MKSVPFPKDGIAIVLSMIVKNEEAIIDRFLDNALPFVDAALISDTGSTDKTLEKIARAQAKYGEAVHVVRDPWRNFGWNRSRAMAFTVAYVKDELEWDLSKTYALLLDADMLLVDEGFSKSKLTAPGYLLLQRSPGLDWQNVRLCRLDHTWTSIGVTHEYWAATPDVVPESLSSLWIRDQNDGKSHAEKQTRDLALLRQGLSEDPTNVRYLFYLAQTLFDLGRYGEARELYERRVEMGGWDEEVWFARYKSGLCSLKVGDEDGGVADLIRAYDSRPARAEPLSALANYFRTSRAKGSAFGLMLAEEALALPTSGDKLFVSTHANAQEPLEEIGILAHYVSRRDLGRDALERLLSLRDVPYDRANQALSNLLFYTKEEFPAVRRGKFHVSEETRTFNGIVYETSSASIVRHLDGIVVNVRLVNYYHERGRVFAGRDPDRKIRTENYAGTFHPESGVLEGGLLHAEIPMVWTDEGRVLGLEDLRFVSHQRKLYFTAVAYQIPGRVDHPQMVFGRGGYGDRFVVCPFEYEGIQPVEKNWLPFSSGKHLLVVYGYEPFRVLKVDVETGKAEVFVEQKLSVSGERWRGSAPPVWTNDGRCFMIVHEVTRRANDNVYLHRFLELDTQTLLPKRYSRIFSFEHHGVEYVLGMIGVDGGNLLVTYGYEERESHWAEIDPNVIEWLELP